MFINAGNPILDLATDRIPWAHYRATAVQVTVPNVALALTLGAREGNVSLHGDKDLSSGVQTLTIPTGMGGTYSISVSGQWQSNAGTRDRFLWVVTPRGTIWMYRQGRTTLDAWSTTSGILSLKDGDTVVCYAQQGTTGNLNFYFGDNTNGSYYGLFLARLSPAKGTIANHTDAGITIL